MKSLQSGEQNIQDYIRLYSALEESQGYTLVRIYKNNFIFLNQLIFHVQILKKFLILFNIYYHEFNSLSVFLKQ